MQSRQLISDIKIGHAYIHRPTGGRYIVSGIAIDRDAAKHGSVGDDGRIVIYHDDDDCLPWYFRPMAEFRDKFEIADTTCNCIVCQ